jgi:hypothetical protein
MGRPVRAQFNRRPRPPGATAHRRPSHEGLGFSHQREEIHMFIRSQQTSIRRYPATAARGRMPSPLPILFLGLMCAAAAPPLARRARWPCRYRQE